MKISIGADHRGYSLKQFFIDTIVDDVCWFDVGTNNTDRTDYPVYAHRVCSMILSGHAECGVLICGSGIGMSIAANRFPKIYAALCWSVDVARLAREHDGANVLVLPSDFLNNFQARDVFISWLRADFSGDRYRSRLSLLDKLGRL